MLTSRLHIHQNVVILQQWYFYSCAAISLVTFRKTDLSIYFFVFNYVDDPGLVMTVALYKIQCNSLIVNLQPPFLHV